MCTTEETHHRVSRTLPLRPSFVEALDAWGWAVEHGGIPLEYAAEVLADHGVYVEDFGVSDPTPTGRWTWAAEGLTDWEGIVVRMAGRATTCSTKNAVTRPPTGNCAKSSFTTIGRTDSPEATTELLLRHCREQIAAGDRAVERELDHGPDIRTTEQGTCGGRAREVLVESGLQRGQGVLDGGERLLGPDFRRQARSTGALLSIPIAAAVPLILRAVVTRAEIGADRRADVGDDPGTGSGWNQGSTRGEPDGNPAPRAPRWARASRAGCTRVRRAGRRPNGHGEHGGFGDHAPSIAGPSYRSRSGRGPQEGFRVPSSDP